MVFRWECFGQKLKFLNTTFSTTEVPQLDILENGLMCSAMSIWKVTSCLIGLNLNNITTFYDSHALIAKRKKIIFLQVQFTNGKRTVNDNEKNNKVTLKFSCTIMAQNFKKILAKNLKVHGSCYVAKFVTQVSRQRGACIHRCTNHA